MDRNLVPWRIVLLFATAYTGCSTQDPSFKTVEIDRKETISDKSLDASVGDDAGKSDAEPVDDDQDNSAIDETIDDSLDNFSDSSGPTDDGAAEERKDPIVIITGEEDADKQSNDIGENLIGEMAVEFQASVIASGQVKISHYEAPTKTLTLTSAKVEESKTFQQINRKKLVDKFQQGHHGSQKTEVLHQNEDNGVLDILVVVDNSGSMREEQINLSGKLSPLLSFVRKSDWQIAVTTTDSKDSCVREIIRKSDVDGEQKFSSAVVPGTSGTGLERGILMAVRGLKGECLSSPWLRPESTVAVLIVSDEDNCSNGRGCRSKPWSTENYLLDHLAAIRQIGVNARVYGIFWEPGKSCRGAYYPGNQYLRAVTQTQGAFGSICSNDYSNTLIAISKNIGTILKSQFALNRAPEAINSVKINGISKTSGWQVTGNVLTFSEAPPEGSTIEVSYQFGSVPMQSQFFLSQMAAQDQMSVWVNGDKTDDYGYDSEGNSITFTRPPPENAAISVSFRERKALQKNFSVGQDVIESSVEVAVGGKTLGADQVSYNQNRGEVQLASPPADGEQIKIDYVRQGDPILSYPYVFQDGQESVAVEEFATGQAVEASYDFATSKITIAANEFADGRKLVLFDPDASQTGFVETKIEVSAEIVKKSVQLQIGSITCNDEDIDILDTIIDISNCRAEGIANAEGTLFYETVASRQQSFVVDADFFKQDHHFQIWAVRVDGRLTTDFVQEANKIVFLEELPLFSRVQVSIKLLGSS